MCPGIVSAVTERTKVIFLCTPNNPTGNRLSEASHAPHARASACRPRSTRRTTSSAKRPTRSRTSRRVPERDPHPHVLEGVRPGRASLGYALAHPAVTSSSCAPSCPGTSRRSRWRARSRPSTTSRSSSVEWSSSATGAPIWRASWRRMRGVTAISSEGNFVLSRRGRDRGVRPKRSSRPCWPRGFHSLARGAPRQAQLRAGDGRDRDRRTSAASRRCARSLGRTARRDWSPAAPDCGARLPSRRPADRRIGRLGPNVLASRGALPRLRCFSGSGSASRH